MMKRIALLIICIVALIASCKRDLLKINVSKIDLEIEILRFDQDLFTTNPEDLPEAIPVLAEKYGRFLSLFNRVINIGEINSPGYIDMMNAFLTDKINNEVYEETIMEYPDLEDLDEKLTRAFKHYRFYFPEKEIPAIYTFVSRFNTSLIVDKNIIGIGLDRYLGADCEYYRQLGLTNYMREKMHRDKIVTDCMYVWANTEWVFEGDGSGEKPGQNVLNNMIYQGKLFYFVKAMMPREREELIMGFSPEQLKWCEMNERNMWSYLIENKLLFDTNYMTINKLIQDGPFTSYFPRESPARASVWIGLQIVEKYMSNMHEMSLQKLMDESDYQQILSLSGYDP
ncbi:MAG: hypothetical protein JSV24_09685 [Bacteroidales bacterium]|nr:MAG: hypothetical protein JSV24_09685 [Bacteroidales bacterium]